MRKKYSDQDIEDTHGPMNSVAKDDAIVWAGTNDEREIRAKKQKAKTSSKKLDRKISKDILKHIME